MKNIFCRHKYANAGLIVGEPLQSQLIIIQEHQSRRQKPPAGTSQCAYHSGK